MKKDNVLIFGYRAKSTVEDVILEILAKQMADEGFEFFESDNGVWLTEEVPVRFIKDIKNNN